MKDVLQNLDNKGVSSYNSVVNSNRNVSDLTPRDDSDFEVTDSNNAREDM